MEFQRALSSPGPPHAVEIAARRVTVVAIRHESGKAVVAASATEPLAPGVMTPGLAHPNIRDTEAVVSALSLAERGSGQSASASLSGCGRACVHRPVRHGSAARP